MSLCYMCIQFFKLLDYAVIIVYSVYVSPSLELSRIVHQAKTPFLCFRTMLLFVSYACHAIVMIIFASPFVFDNVYLFIVHSMYFLKNCHKFLHIES